MLIIGRKIFHFAFSWIIISTSNQIKEKNRNKILFFLSHKLAGSFSIRFFGMSALCIYSIHIYMLYLSDVYFGCKSKIKKNSHTRHSIQLMTKIKRKKNLFAFSVSNHNSIAFRSRQQQRKKSMKRAGEEKKYIQIEF